MDVYLIRHTSPEIPAGLCYGRLDVSMPSDVAGDAAKLLPQLPPGPPIVSDTSLRCAGLAAHLAKTLAGTTRVDARLAELDFGAWEGRLWADIPRIQTSVWAKDVWNQAPPDGESYAALHRRVAAAWEAILEIESSEVVVVAAIGPLRVLIATALELPAEAFLRFQIDYAGLAKLSDASGGWRLEFANR
jgi:alpha-ribazole phosphatase